MPKGAAFKIFKEKRLTDVCQYYQWVQFPVLPPTWSFGRLNGHSSQLLSSRCWAPHASVVNSFMKLGIKYQGWKIVDFKSYFPENLWLPQLKKLSNRPNLVTFRVGNTAPLTEELEAHSQREKQMLLAMLFSTSKCEKSKAKVEMWPLLKHSYSEVEHVPLLLLLISTSLTKVHTGE